MPEIERCLPKSVKRRPIGRRTLAALVPDIENSLARQLLELAVEMDRVSCRHEQRGIDDEVWELLIDCGEPVPALPPGRVADHGSGAAAEYLENLQAGKAVSIVAEHQELTTQRAANLLGVSRPFLVRLLEEGHIPFHMVASHRRIYLRDLLVYKHRRDNARHEALDQLAKAELEAGTYNKVFLPEGAEEE